MLICLLAFALAQPARAWRKTGHDAVNETALAALPADHPAFFGREAARIVSLGLEPDRWRDPSALFLQAAQAPEHFIQLERLGFLTEWPISRYEFIRELGARGLSVTDAGLAPYAAMEVYERLRVSFKEYRSSADARQRRQAEQSAAFYAGWLGHYIADMANPHHCSVHIRGWVGENGNGYPTDGASHDRFEHEFLELIRPRRAEILERVPRARRRLETPFAAILDFARSSNALIETLYRFDLDGAFSRPDPAARQFAFSRLAAGAELLADLWHTAWVSSAPSGATPASAPSQGERKQ